ncbi:hypothetical protein [Fodinicola acaciae]|uniref:hypothetical protein n=1 Tax=Fodinicola acaciae TaxID=2681555 RepID=UPI0013D556E1|nr:hypothetical protein [Fodinicola acaciae]
MADPVSGGELSRRTFLTVSGALASGAVLATGESAQAADLPLDERQTRMVLRVAAFGARVPAPLPDFGESGPAMSRATADRLAGAVAGLPEQRLALVRAAADSLLQEGLVDGDDATMLAAIGKRAVEPDKTDGLIALVALAAATVTRQVKPTADDLAKVWLAAIARLSASTKARVHR